MKIHTGQFNSTELCKLTYRPIRMMVKCISIDWNLHYFAMDSFSPCHFDCNSFIYWLLHFCILQKAAIALLPVCFRATFH